MLSLEIKTKFIFNFLDERDLSPPDKQNPLLTLQFIIKVSRPQKKKTHRNSMQKANLNKRPMNHIAHLSKHFLIMNKCSQKYDYRSELVKSWLLFTLGKWRGRKFKQINVDVVHSKMLCAK